MSIIVKDLTKIYGSQKSVNNISFNISKGEIVGFLGPNGAGKSTTMKMLTSFIQPTSGEAIVAGYNVVEHPDKIKKLVGYLPESNPLYFDMYIKEYLTMTAKIHQLDNVSQKVEDVIQKTGLQKEKHKKIGTLSKGYKQRVGIAQAIIHDPQVLILDEPTSGLDPNQIDEIRKLILEIGKDKSVLLSTHIMQEVEAMCSRVIIIKDGTIVKNDAIDKVTISENSHQSIHLITNNDLDINTISVYTTIDIHHIKSVNKREFFIETQNIAATKKAILKLSLEKDIEIKSLNEHNATLEEVFKSLTQ